MTKAEQSYLSHGVERLRPLMEERGFRYEPGDDGVSSGGAFASAFFRRGKLALGPIVRHRRELGCPSYTVGEGYAGHEDLFWALGHEGEARLVSSDSISYRAKDGGDVFTALLIDLRDVVLPALEHSESDFSNAVVRAQRRFGDRLRGKSSK